MKKFKVTFYTDEYSKERFSEIVEAVDENSAEMQILEKYQHNVFIDKIFDCFDTPLNNKKIYVDMPDGLTYAIPVMVVAEHKGYRMAKYHNDDFYTAMVKEVLPEFENDNYQIKDWAKNNMNWQDVKKEAIVLKRKVECDYQEYWVNGEFEIK